jgi:hypothetical protein
MKPDHWLRGLLYTVIAAGLALVGLGLRRWGQRESVVIERGARR